MKKKRKYVKRVCSLCLKWNRGYCSALAKIMVANHPVCDYGRKLIINETSRRWMAAKRMKPNNNRKEVIDMGKCCGGKKGCKGGGKKGK